jgi:large subunit ribosomal protein L13
MIIIDAKNQIVGRIAVVAAKQALLGEKVAVVNSELGVISGRKENVLAKFKRKQDMGVPRKGPFQPRMPDRFTRRIIRGMLPMDKARGKAAYKRVMCHIGMPKDLEGKEITLVPGADAGKLPTLNKVSVGDICKFLGAEWN